jgi:hypothetical protein
MPLRPVPVPLLRRTEVLISPMAMPGLHGCGWVRLAADGVPRLHENRSRHEPVEKESQEGEK